MSDKEYPFFIYGHNLLIILTTRWLINKCTYILGNVLVMQIALRWIYEKGTSAIVKSFNKERMKLNLDLFDWELNLEEAQKFSQIPQSRMCSGYLFISENGPYKSYEELWDGDP